MMQEYTTHSHNHRWGILSWPPFRSVAAFAFTLFMALLYFIFYMVFVVVSLNFSSGWRFDFDLAHGCSLTML
jgi:hypothetical protein